MTKIQREIVRICVNEGLVINNTCLKSKHMKIFSNKGMLVCGHTPSDRRWARKVRSQARRMAHSCPEENCLSVGQNASR